MSRKKANYFGFDADDKRILTDLGISPEPSAAMTTQQYTGWCALGPWTLLSGRVRVSTNKGCRHEWYAKRWRSHLGSRHVRVCILGYILGVDVFRRDR